MQVHVPRKNLGQIVRIIVLLAAAFAAAVPVSAANGKEVPFHASFATVFQSTVVFPEIHVTVQGAGQADHLGRTTTFTSNQVGNVISNHTTATYILVAANGDKVVIEDATTDHLDLVAGTVSFVGTYTVVGGTGRFAGATGNGVLVGSAQFLGPNSGIGQFTLDGTISSPGSLK